MRKIIPNPVTAFDFSDISIIPRLEKISAQDEKLLLKTSLTRRISIGCPFVASPMDSVINLKMAICMDKFDMIPIFYIREENQEEISALITRYISCSSGKFGIATPTSIEFINKIMEKYIFHNCLLVALDTLHSKPYNHLITIQYLRKQYKNIEIISGNVTNANDCARVIECGADAVRVGMTFNSINKGYEMTGCGRRQASSIYECAEEADKYGVPIIADGGVKHISDIAKCIALGASSVMMGKMFAMMDESPCRVIDNGGIEYKQYKGMSRIDIIDNDMCPEGDEILIKKGGTFDSVVSGWIKRLKIALVRSGACSIVEMRENSMLEYFLSK